MIWLRSRQPHQVNAISHRRSCNDQGARTNFDDCKHSLFTRPQRIELDGTFRPRVLAAQVAQLAGDQTLALGITSLEVIACNDELEGFKPRWLGPSELEDDVIHVCRD